MTSSPFLRRKARLRRRSAGQQFSTMRAGASPRGDCGPTRDPPGIVRHLQVHRQAGYRAIDPAVTRVLVEGSEVETFRLVELAASMQL